jgi:DUF1365 family protein
MTRSALYCGELMHARHDHFARAFRYRVYMASLDPDELPELDRGLRLFSLARRNVYSIDPRDYTTPLASQGAATRVVTNLRVLGYVFNPVSFFLTYDGARPSAMVAEVNNTYGGRRCYALAANDRIAPDGLTEHDVHRVSPDERRVGFRVDRDFFVSPFLHGELRYDFWLDAPLDGDRLAIEMHAHDHAHDHAASPRRVFTARFAGERIPLTDRALARVSVRYPWITAQVIGLIHWQALKLRALGAPYRRPGADHRPHVADLGPRPEVQHDTVAKFRLSRTR